MPGLGFAQMQVEIGMAVTDHRQQRRQHIGRDRGDHPEPQRPGEHVALDARRVDDVAGAGENARPAFRDLASGPGQHHPAVAAFDQFDPQRPLQLLNLHRQSGLGHGALLGRLAEMPGARHGVEITQLFQ